MVTDGQTKLLACTGAPSFGYFLRMLVFRIACAAVIAATLLWVLAQPEAARLMRTIPDLGAIAPIAGAYIGAFNLAVRQGWGVVVALANGVWAGILTIGASGVLYTAIDLARGIAAGDIRGIGGFFDHFGNTVELLLTELGDAHLLMLSLAAAAAAGVLTELIHWLMVRARSRSQRWN
jgi:hypothetical protein